MGKSIRKATNELVTEHYLIKRSNALKNGGYEKSKWIVFCETLLERGFTLVLYEARETFSKYITVQGKSNKPYKVRFSNHPPIKNREISGDCDFFVGRTHLHVATTEDALRAVEKHFNN